MSKRKVPALATDEEAEAFLEGDLSDLDYGAFKPLTLISESGTARMEVRLPATLAQAVEARAIEKGISQERLIREAIERAVQG